MPRYDYQCQECLVLFEVEHPIKDVGKRVDCVECSGRTNRVYSTVSIKGFTPYYEKGLGRTVTSARQSERLDKKLGRVQVRDLPWFKQEIKKHRDSKRKVMIGGK